MIDNTIEPQFLFLYNQRGYIKEVKIITLIKEYEETQSFQYYYNFRKSYPNYFINDNETVINDHILLTLTIEEIRGYIQHKILKSNKKILLFSIWDNIDYKNTNNSIFSPFTSKFSFDKIPNNTLIYEIYSKIFVYCFICVIEEDELKQTELCSDGVYNSYIDKIIDQIRQSYEISDWNHVLKLTEYIKDVNLYNISWSGAFFQEILYNTLYSKTITFYNNGTFLITGGLMLEDEPDLKEKFIILYDEKKTIFEIKDDMLYINDSKKYSNFILYFFELEKLILKQQLIKQHLKLDFTITLKSFSFLDFDNIYFLEHNNKTKNIFLDRTKKTNIILSMNHIYFSSFNLNIYLSYYITKIIICLQIVKNNVDYFIKEKKVGLNYYSRFCQGIRKPIPIYKPNLNQYKNINNIIYKKDKEGEIFFNYKTNQYLQCKDPTIPHIGFIDILNKGYKVCLPCCYKKEKNETNIYQTCVYNTSLIKNEFINPFLSIFIKYRVILDENKIGLLLYKMNRLFNNIPQETIFEKTISTNSENFTDNITETELVIELEQMSSNKDQYLYLSKENKIIRCKNFVFYKVNKDFSQINNINEVLNKKDLNIYFKDDHIFISNFLLSQYYENEENIIKNIKFFLLIKNQLHTLVCANKNNNEEIILTDLTYEIKKRIIKKFLPKLDCYQFNLESNNIVYNEKKIQYIKTNKNFFNNNFESVSTFYQTYHITLEKNTIGYVIVSIFYKKFFDLIKKNEIELNNIKKIFLINLINISRFKHNLNKIYNQSLYTDDINYLFQFLNPRYINFSLDIE